ncbi:N-acetylglucosamine kinase [Couchioplanes azureus]|uniref:N-acetylglucosamine kinase n=1 Tax=Couchioplanes caeruleus TaxID=56438 RepID=UPI00166FDF12|nr:BadF/BadG/BcrA/BcrD ATPase family protein [Couchioplanes caeruleus]GGQ75954.1 kinase [Couchioplanes caeruleus subsp. azureus]
MTAYYLAVDGGNSKTDVLLGSGDGEILGFVRGPATSPHTLGLDGAVDLLAELVRTVRAEAGVAPAAVIDLAAVYLAGADLPVEVFRLRQAISARRWTRQTVVDNDTFALLRAGTSRPDAVAVVCGAGSNCVGRAADGRAARFVALGPISGDWGGGHDLAAHTLRLAARGEDGRGVPTALSAAVARYFGRATVEEVSIALHLGELAAVRVRELTPLLFEVAATGDPVATGLVRRQAHEVVVQHRVAAARLGLLDAPHALVLGGGVLRARHPVLHRRVLAGVRRQAPRVEVSVPDSPPALGAALLALDALGATSAAAARLRAAMRTAVPGGMVAPAPVAVPSAPTG